MVSKQAQGSTLPKNVSKTSSDLAADLTIEILTVSYYVLLTYPCGIEDKSTNPQNLELISRPIVLLGMTSIQLHSPPDTA